MCGVLAEHQVYICSTGAPSSLGGGSKWMGVTLAGFFPLVMKQEINRQEDRDRVDRQTSTVRKERQWSICGVCCWGWWLFRFNPTQNFRKWKMFGDKNKYQGLFLKLYWNKLNLNTTVITFQYHCKQVYKVKVYIYMKLHSAMSSKDQVFALLCFLSCVS